MEFLRFGSSIPGSYWGCCACDIIQNFKCDPDEKASIQLVNGDGGNPILADGGFVFAGPTERDIFHQRLRFGTFDKRDMPNHAFIAILTEWQLNTEHGKKWLKILKDTGFEFIRSVSNSVYTGDKVGDFHEGSRGNNKNYIFMLVRNIGVGGDCDSFTPPSGWEKISGDTPEAWQFLDKDTRTKLAEGQHKSHKKVWDEIGSPKLLSEAEVVAAGAPVIYAGLRSANPQQPKAMRNPPAAAASSPWGAKAYA